MTFQVAISNFFLLSLLIGSLSGLLGGSSLHSPITTVSVAFGKDKFLGGAWDLDDKAFNNNHGYWDQYGIGAINFYYLYYFVKSYAILLVNNTPSGSSTIGNGNGAFNGGLL